MSLKQHLTACFFFLILAVNSVVFTLPFYFIILFKFLPFEATKKACSAILNWLAEGWISVIHWGIHHMLPTHWEITIPDNLCLEKWRLVICNHQSATDTAALFYVFNKKIPFIKFFIKDQLKWVPLLGVAWVGLDYPRMKRYSKKVLAKKPHLKGRDIEFTKKFCERFKRKPTTILNFVEGTRFSKSKQKKSPYQHLLQPRAGGIAYVLTCMGEQIREVLDITITYPDNRKTLWEFLGGTVSRIHVEAKINTTLLEAMPDDYFHDIPGQDKFKAALNALWEEKDQQMNRIISSTITKPAKTSPRQT